MYSYNAIINIFHSHLLPHSVLLNNVCENATKVVLSPSPTFVNINIKATTGFNEFTSKYAKGVCILGEQLSAYI